MNMIAPLSGQAHDSRFAGLRHSPPPVGFEISRSEPVSTTQHVLQQAEPSQAIGPTTAEKSFQSACRKLLAIGPRGRDLCW
jgi:hypothetical protein